MNWPAAFSTGTGSPYSICQEVSGTVAFPDGQDNNSQAEPTRPFAGGHHATMFVEFIEGSDGLYDGGGG